MDRKKIHKLLEVALDIVEMENGKDGFPFVNFAVSNYPVSLVIYMKDTGFTKGVRMDGYYLFDLAGGTDQGEYDACLEHLEELKEKAENLLKKEKRL